MTREAVYVVIRVWRPECTEAACDCDRVPPPLHPAKKKEKTRTTHCKQARAKQGSSTEVKEDGLNVFEY